MRKLIVSLTALALAGCFSPGQSDRHGHAGAGVWGDRNPAANAEAREVQVIVARQAKEARCKDEVSQRQGTDGTSPRDYKCKRFNG
jgi:hypothetical protein